MPGFVPDVAGMSVERRQFQWVPRAETSLDAAQLAEGNEELAAGLAEEEAELADDGDND